jgi:CheY-like chemotaxis protein
VIVNLAVNAEDAMPDGGTLTFETAETELKEDHAAAIEGVEPGTYVKLGVRDTGCGMDRETLERVFEPFFTTKETDKGTGLGLATVYGIVKQHGGNIRVRSERGKGTSFDVYFPVSEEAGVHEEDAASEHGDLHGSETILLVEDNEQVRILSLAILEQQGYAVLTAENGRKALMLLDKHDGSLDLLLTDVVMPEISGKDLFERISGDYPDLKVLYMSGYTDDVIGHRGMLDEGVNFIQKPFSAKGLAAKVRQTLDEE